MPKDKLGNELEVGHIVAVQLPQQILFADIVDIANGNIAQASQIASLRPGAKVEARITPGVVSVMISWAFAFDPSNPILPDLARVFVEPKKQQEHMERTKRIQEAAKSTSRDRRSHLV